jgi:hypothetical protein
MPYTVTVALFNREQGILKFDPPISEQTRELCWDQRIKVALEVDDDETLASVMDRAKRTFNLRPRIHVGDGADEEMGPEGIARLPHFFAFYETDNDPPLQQRGSTLFAFNLVTVDRQRRAHWNRQSDQIPYGDLVRGAEVGLLDGNPLRPYFYLGAPGGGDAFREAWTVLQTVWTITGGIMGTVAAIKLTADQSRRLLALLRGTDVVKKQSQEWTTRGGGPSEIRKAVERQAWAPADMRALLDLDSDEDAVAVLELFGSARNADGTYSMTESEEAELLRIIEREAVQLSNVGYRELSDEDRQMIEDRLCIILRTGNAPEHSPPSPSHRRDSGPSRD